MKIIQSFWSNPNFNNPLQNTAGWLSAEYHWMSWALSVLTLKEQYNSVSLFTDTVGKNVLANILNLPYNNVNTQLDSLQNYSRDMWALGKIYTYSLQNEPFLHIDGDIYLWQKLDNRFETAELIAQNPEINFKYYYKTLQEMKEYFTYIPTCMVEEMQKIPIQSCNTGLIGGTRIDVFKEYAHLAFKLIEENKTHLEKIDRKTFNIGFEQFLYHSLAEAYNIPITYLIEREEDFDPTYKGFARFDCVPYQTKFIHTLGEFKCQPDTCRHLAKRLRQDYPTYYYHIIDVCKEAGVELDCKYYQTSSSENAYSKHYKQDVKQYKTIEQLFGNTMHNILSQELQLSDQVSITDNFVEGKLQQTLTVPDIYTLSNKAIILDALNMVLLDGFVEHPITIEESIRNIAPYFNQSEIMSDYDIFQQLVLERIKELMYEGALIKS